MNAVGSWERSSLAHLDESALSKPAQRFPLSDSGLSGHNLNAARAVCALWNNQKWMNQSPMPGLSPISLKDTLKNVTLRQIAQLTKVKPSEATPDGFPPMVIKALRKGIENGRPKVQSRCKSTYWSQSQALPLALEILKRELKIKEKVSSGFTSSPSHADGKNSDGDTGSERRVRRKLGVGNQAGVFVL